MIKKKKNGDKQVNTIKGKQIIEKQQQENGEHIKTSLIVGALDKEVEHFYSRHVNRV